MSCELCSIALHPGISPLRRGSAYLTTGPPADAAASAPTPSPFRPSAPPSCSPSSPPSSLPPLAPSSPLPSSLTRPPWPARPSSRPTSCGAPASPSPSSSSASGSSARCCTARPPAPGSLPLSFCRSARVDRAGTGSSRWARWSGRWRTSMAWGWGWRRRGREGPPSRRKRSSGRRTRCMPAGYARASCCGDWGWCGIS